MSYTVLLAEATCGECGRGGAVTDIGNYTSNMRAWFHLIVGWEWDNAMKFGGADAAKFSAAIDRGVDWWQEMDPLRRRTLEMRYSPENGWGDAGSAVKFLERISEAAYARPVGSTVRIHA